MRTTSLSFLLVVCLLPATLRAQAPAPREAEAALTACLAASAPGSVLAGAARDEAATRAERLSRAEV